MVETATLESFWNSVLGGNRDADDVVRECRIVTSVPHEVGRWLDSALAAARAKGYTQEMPYSVWTSVRDELVEAVIATSKERR